MLFSRVKSSSLGMDSFRKSCDDHSDSLSFVGLTPGILVCLGIVHWVNGFIGSRKGSNKGKKQGQMIRVLRYTSP